MGLHYSKYTTPGAGYIAPSEPNAANHVIVGNLGEEEILLIACDNGNVVGYRTELIFSTFELIEDNDFSEQYFEIDIKPFLVQSVGQSACKLATIVSSAIMADLPISPRGAGAPRSC